MKRAKYLKVFKLYYFEVSNGRIQNGHRDKFNFFSVNYRKTLYLNLTVLINYKHPGVCTHQEGANKMDFG